MIAMAHLVDVEGSTIVELQSDRSDSSKMCSGGPRAMMSDEEATIETSRSGNGNEADVVPC